jgi:hypothetical protein
LFKSIAASAPLLIVSVISCPLSFLLISVCVYCQNSGALVSVQPAHYKCSGCA